MIKSNIEIAMNELNVQWAGVDTHIECRVKVAGRIHEGVLHRVGTRTAVLKSIPTLRSGDHVVIYVHDKMIPAEIIHGRGAYRELLLDREIDVAMLVGRSIGLFAPVSQPRMQPISWAA